jgi:SAM-dependent methyltransferase
MSGISDTRYLQTEQYKDADHLKARIQLHLRFSTNKYGWFKWIFDQLLLPHRARILELGCGPGSLWHENIYHLPDEWSVVLSDFSPGMVRDCKLNLEEKGMAFSFVSSNAVAIPFPASKFDAVIANHMLYHVPDKQMTFAEITRVLKPGGQLFASTNGDHHLIELNEIFDRHINFSGKRYSPSFSAESFTLDNGKELLSPWFSEVRILRYEDSLEVTDTVTLVAYILSMVPYAELPADIEFMRQLTADIDQQIQQRGAIRIQKSIGMFVCDK